MTFSRTLFFVSSIALFGVNEAFMAQRGFGTRIVTQIMAKDAVNAKESYVVGENVPEEILKQATIYDMILVERFSAPEKTSSGLWTPVTEGKDKKHLSYVISVPTDYGLESEQGRIQPIQVIAPYKAGDIVWVTDPWGIGPKDQKHGDRCFSFHKADHITAVLKKAE